jgi:nitroimidazol reductase NimA-like FMN-containing flavoprotein (pyridoxamine 5'-phosphate oxidase superfamily)
MTSRFRDDRTATVTPPRLSTEQIDELLGMRLIANLATTADDGSIHVVPMWFKRDGDYILIPTSQFTRKYKNVSKRPHASIMIDVSRSGMDLRGVLITGTVEIVRGDDARALNRSIHLRYITPEGLAQDDVAVYLVEGDDVTLKIAMDRIVTWNHADSPAGRAIARSRHFYPLDGQDGQG